MKVIPAEQQFDPKTCVTAGELRASGLALPTAIPDCGWVLRASVRYDFKVDRTRIEEVLTGTLRGAIEVSFTEPFRWTEASVRMREEADHGHG